MMNGGVQNGRGGGYTPSDPDLVEVGVGRIALAEHPKRLLTPALGSCVGVALYDPVAHRGALAHIMLPKPVEAGFEGLPERFAEYAVPKMVAEMETAGSRRSHIVAKMAGGSAMFRADSVLASIGERNAAEARRQLGLFRIPVLAEDIGGSHARTVELYLDTGAFIVRSYLHGVREL